MLAIAAICLLRTTPLQIGRAELDRAAGARKSDVTLQIRKSGKREAFEITGDGKKVRIVGSDQNGAMYGAAEFAEALKRDPGHAWSMKVKREPYLVDRGVNLFLTLPWNYQKNDTDYELGALTDPKRWWFHNEDYWVTLLDLMARSRLNWLDIHGAWDISVTNAPNLYAYFVTSRTFPKVGVPEQIKAANLRQLNHVIDLAHDRGIRVSLMAYEANLRIPQNPNPGYEATEANIYKYTKEVVEETIRKAPGLDAIGFRIGESGRSESFFKCYGEAVKASGRDIPLITRSWITTKQKVLPLARASKDFTVEIKYNGEQWGAPYPVMGGRMANWYSYSFEDYLTDSRDEGLGRGTLKTATTTHDARSTSHASRPSSASEKLWPGWPAEGGGNWPSQPYKIVWQVRANGTHRIFPFYNPTWVRRTISAMRMGTASGYTIEGEDAYYPKSPDYYLANPKDKYYEWIHQRDEMYWMTWGRLGYDPRTPESVFDARARELLGPKSEEMVQVWKQVSTKLPWAFMAFSLGSDHRDHAPELEWGGDSTAFIQGQGLDSLVFTPINEEFANRATKGIDGRASVWDLAVSMNSLLSLADAAESYSKSANPRGREIAEGVRMMSLLGYYYRGRFRSAHALANMEATFGAQFRDTRVENMFEAAGVLQLMAENRFYKPFTERLRMRTNTFTWKQEAIKANAEAERIKSLPEPPKELEFWAANMNGVGYMHGEDAKLAWRDENGDIVCRLTNAKPERAWLLVKPLPSSTFFHRMPMRKIVGGFEARFPRKRWGHVIAAEATAMGEAARFPDAQKESPYLVVPAQSGPTPQIYNSQEALRYLDSKAINPEIYGGMVIGTRANNFFNRFDNATKRKILEPVSRGMRMVILQQDFTRYKLDWLPKPLKVEAGNWSVFDPGSPFGLRKIESPDIMWQRFLPSEGWQIYGNGGLAMLKVGKGEVWVTSARLMQKMHLPDVAVDFVQLLCLGGPHRPTILVDACSESAAYTSSCHSDLMNSHNIPFLTLGEVIAEVQGMNSFEPIPGPVNDDDVLGGMGRDIANRFLREQVVAMSKRPAPKSQAEFKTGLVRRKKELMRTLGLDPLPAKTPLNTRITGTIDCDGYRIEKLVFESRPKIYVTAHVYVPSPSNLVAQASSLLLNGPPGGAARFPVIVNVNGHWAHKKDEDRIQLRCAFQARQGYIAIAIDSPGWSFEGNSLIERRAEGNHNDWTLVQGGTNTTGYYVWDAIRSLDYMATRPDTDMTRIGITGASGGGLATLYTFAADDRYKVAVPVVYMSSMELAPDNGCLCNHVPGTCQVGDRCDVIGIQAPKPVLIMGAENDGEFPPEAMRLTHKKMQDIWKVFGKSRDVYVRIFSGGHDYSQSMREASLGFFNRYLKGEGDGSPVPQPELKAFDPEQRLLLALDPPATDERTMRDLAIESLMQAPKAASAAEAIAVNGGRPPRTPFDYKESGDQVRKVITFKSEPGLVTPGVLYLPSGKVERVVIHVSDAGKATLPRAAESGAARLNLDILGTGELAGIELRYPVYAGRSVAFTGGWQIIRAAEAMRKFASRIEIVGDGPLASQAAMWAGLLDPGLAKITATGCLREWTDVFKDGVTPYAIQPRANLCGSLEHLRSFVKNATWRD